MPDNDKNATVFKVVPRVKKKAKYKDVPDCAFFYDGDNLAVKIPEMKDEHGPVNCVCIEDQKGYFIKEWQEVLVVGKVRVLV
jgi:hypothetical protein